MMLFHQTSVGLQFSTFSKAALPVLVSAAGEHSPTSSILRFQQPSFLLSNNNHYPQPSP